MFIPLFIAILLGLVSPSNSNQPTSPGTTTTVSTTDNGGSGNEAEDPGNDTGGDDTGGEQGHLPPIKP